MDSVVKRIISIMLLLAAVASVHAADCGGTLQILEPCLPAIEGSAPPAPSEACCAAVRMTDASCLCSVVVSYASAMDVNLQSAINLPRECHRAVPAGYKCNGYSVPSGVPAGRKLMM